ncbi:S-layer homology domain-containing protein [Paenibacillus daejeonensis]|uniref:S-layer homology domain-containing protein n=1 Tax=Paenibacillus daejeonensis TaxID=135193 RepID=UPI000374D6CB|nr:S-layer homology domain-containing protein [Paenibacillus daejeonensis]
MPRKLLSLILSLCLAITLALPAATAAEAPVFTLSSSASSVSQNQTFTVDIQGASLADLYAYEIQLQYDPARLEVDTSKPFTEQSGYALPLKVTQEGGTAYVSLVYTRTGALTGLNGSLPLGTLTFKALQPGTTELALKQVKTSTSSLKDVLVHTPDAKATVRITSTYVDPGPPPTSGGPQPGEGTEQEPSTPTPAGTVTLTSEQLTASTGGKVTVSLPAGSTVVQLPANAASLLDGVPLDIRSQGGSLELPSSVLAQLAELVPAQEREGSTIMVSLQPATAAEQASVTRQAAQQLAADVKVGSVMYDLSLSITTEAGQTYSLSSFQAPVTLRLQMTAGIQPRLSGIYYVPESGGLDYLGGTFTNGAFVVQVNHFSSYTVLEVTKTFTDVPQTHWAHGVIQELAARQIVSGVTDRTFEPSSQVTRAQFTALLVRALHLDSDAPAADFTDIRPADWFAAEVAAAVQVGLVNGRGDGTFAPHASITREEMTAMLMRAYPELHGEPVAGLPVTFADESSIAPWALDDVRMAASMGLVQGRASGQFVPKGIATRAEAAQMLYRLIGL